MATWGTGISLKGIKGDAGLSVLSGAGAPSSSLGFDTQVYINTTTGDVYAKASGAWTLTKNLVGPMGINGINGSFFTGTGAPTSATYSGSGQAIYIQVTGEVWTYASSTTGWVDSGESLLGPQGPAGIRGTQTFLGHGAPSADLTTFSNGVVTGAVVGDLYYDLDAGPSFYVLGN